MVSVEQLIQEALAKFQSKEQFRSFFERTIMQDHSVTFLWNPRIGEVPASEVDNIYQILLDGEEATRQQLDLFEESAFEIILDESQYVRKAPYTNITFGDLLFLDMGHKSPSIINGKWPRKIKEAIKLEDIAIGNIRHNPHNSNEQLNGQSPTFYHQERLLEFLVGCEQAQQYGDKFWQKIRQNPSFVEIDFLLALRENNKAVENVLPKLFRFYHETLAPDVAPDRCYFVVFLCTHLNDELVIERFLAEPENEYATKVKALYNMHVYRPKLASVFNQGDAVFMTGYKREGDTANINYVLVENGILSREQTTLDMRTGRVLKGKYNYSPMLWDFAKQYETFVERYKTELRKF